MTLAHGITEIRSYELHLYEDTECPKCQDGILKREPDHDAVGGNKTVLRCTKRDYTIDIVR